MIFWLKALALFYLIGVVSAIFACWGKDIDNLRPVPLGVFGASFFFFVCSGIGFLYTAFVYLIKLL